jgi:hypothetical protein
LVEGGRMLISNPWAGNGIPRIGGTEFFEQILKDTLTLKENSENLTFRRGGPEDLPELYELYGGQRTLKKLSVRFSLTEWHEPMTCFIATDNKGLACAVWTIRQKSRFPILGLLNITILPDEAYIVDAFTRKDARRKGFYGKTLDYAFQQLAIGGVRRVVWCVNGKILGKKKVCRGQSIGKFRHFRLNAGNVLVFGLGKVRAHLEPFLPSTQPHDGVSEKFAGRA